MYIIKILKINVKDVGFSTDRSVYGMRSRLKQFQKLNNSKNIVKVWENESVNFCLFIFKITLLCSAGCPGTQNVIQLSWNSQRSACLCLTSAEIKDLCHHA